MGRAMALTVVPAPPDEVARMLRAPSALAHDQAAARPGGPVADAKADAVRTAMAALIEAAFAP